MAGCAIALGLMVGGAGIAPLAVLRALVDRSAPDHQMLWSLRAARVATGFATGALLAVAGALLQQLLRNPLAEPYVLGLSGGAALGTFAALLAGLGALGIAVAGGVGAALALAALFGLAAREFRLEAGEGASERLILSGVMLAALWGALMTLALSLAPGAHLQALVFWLMGDLEGSLGGWWLYLVLVAALVAGVRLAPALNVYAQGDDFARALGVDVGRLRQAVVIMAAAATGAAVAVAGPIGFVGLVAPHLVRRLAGADVAAVLPGSALAGGALVVCADALARTVIAPEQLPVGAITALIGAPAFLSLLWRERR